MYDDDDLDYIPENQRPECRCGHCVTLGWEAQTSDCIWFSRGDS